MDDLTTDDVAGPDDESGDKHALTRREAMGAGAAAGITAFALSAETAVGATASQCNRTITINAPRDVVFDLDAVQRIQKDILGRLGCQACCSGFDILFPDEAQYVLGRNDKLKQLSPAQVKAKLGVNR